MSCLIIIRVKSLMTGCAHELTLSLAAVMRGPVNYDQSLRSWVPISTNVISRSNYTLNLEDCLDTNLACGECRSNTK